MSNLIEAFKIFLKYGDECYPTNCNYDILTVHGKHYTPEFISKEDMGRLYVLGFYWDNDGYFASSRYGSC